MDETIRDLFSFWVQKSFRDIADQDYLSARPLNRNKLFQVSVWSALQAVEKYLKGILLFSYQCTKNYNHNLPKLWQDVEKLPQLKVELPTDCVEFLEYLKDQGNNRYLDYPLSFEGDELFKLDRCVWHIRRYCQDFLLLPEDEKRYPGKSQSLLRAIPREATPEAVKLFHLQYGFLETLLDDMKNPLRTVLVWKNKYYGKYKKYRIHYAATMSWERPVYMIFPKLLEVIKPVASIPNATLKELEKYRDEMMKKQDAT